MGDFILRKIKKKNRSLQGCEHIIRFSAWNTYGLFNNNFSAELKRYCTDNKFKCKNVAYIQHMDS